MSLSEKLPANLRRLRLKKKLSQQALADRADLTVGYVSMVECGKRTPPLGTIETLGRALRVNPVELLS